LAGTARPMIAPSKCVGRHARPAGLFNFAQTLRGTLSNVQKSGRLTMGRDPVTGSRMQGSGDSFENTRTGGYPDETAHNSNYRDACRCRRCVWIFLLSETSNDITVVQHTSEGSTPVPPPELQKVGDCAITTIMRITARIEGTSAHDTGSAIVYANGVSGVSYEYVPPLHASRIGDQVRLCLVSIFKSYPPGDDADKNIKLRISGREPLGIWLQK